MFVQMTLVVRDTSVMSSIADFCSVGSESFINSPTANIELPGLTETSANKSDDNAGDESSESEKETEMDNESTESEDEGQLAHGDGTDDSSSSSESETEEEDRTQRKRKRKSIDTRRIGTKPKKQRAPRPTRGEQPKSIQKALTIAKGYFRCHIVTKEPFGTQSEREQGVVDAWAYACQKRGIKERLTDELHFLV